MDASLAEEHAEIIRAEEERIQDGLPAARARILREHPDHDPRLLNYWALADAQKNRESVIATRVIASLASDLAGGKAEREELTEKLTDFFERRRAGGFARFYEAYLREQGLPPEKREVTNSLREAFPDRFERIVALLQTNPMLQTDLLRARHHANRWAEIDDLYTRKASEIGFEEIDRLSAHQTLQSANLPAAREQIRARAAEESGRNSAERQLASAAEVHGEQAENAVNRTLRQLAETVWAGERTPEQQQARVEQLRTFFEGYGTASDPSGLTHFLARLQDANVRFFQNDREPYDRLAAEVNAAFPGDAGKILSELSFDINLIASIRDISFNRQLARLAEIDRENGAEGRPTQYYERAMAVLLDESIPEAGRLHLVRRILEEAAAEDATLRESIQISSRIELAQERALQLEEEGAERPQRESETEETLESTVQPFVALASFGVEAERFRELPPEAQAGLSEVMENAQAREIVGLLLRSDVSFNDNELTGAIAGADVNFSYADRSFSIVGAQNRYAFDPSPEGYDTTRVRSMAAEGGSFEIRENESLADVIGLFLAREDLHDGETMDRFTANKIRNFMRLLCGGNVDAREERQRLQQLGVYRGGNISPLQIERFAIALPHYFGKAGETSIDSGGPLGFDAMVTLAQIWKEEGFQLPPANDLIRRTQAR